MIDLVERRVLRPVLPRSGHGRQAAVRLELPPFNGDVLPTGTRAG